MEKESFFARFDVKGELDFFYSVVKNHVFRVHLNTLQQKKISVSTSSLIKVEKTEK